MGFLEAVNWPGAWLLHWSRKRLEVSAHPQTLRRGEELRVELALPVGADRAEHAWVGIVCDEKYEVMDWISERESPRLRTEIAHMQWEHVDLETPKSLIFPVPPSAPFSYLGVALQFKWRIEVRRTRGWWPDAVQMYELEVRP